MIKTALYVLAGLMLGLVIHIVVVLSLPAQASLDLWSKLVPLGAINRLVVLPPPRPGEPNPLQLDPEIAYGICQLDLSSGPGAVAGVLPDAFWSVALYGRSGNVIYSTTNRDGIGQTLDLGIFNADQTRQLAQQQLDVAEGLLIVESPEDAIFVVVRLAPPHPAMRARFEAILGALTCGNL